MYKNVGKKIKAIANILCYIGVAISVIIGFVILIQSDGDGIFSLFGIVIMVFGSLLSWLSSIFTYGFGELIDTNSKIVKNFRFFSEEKEHLNIDEKIATLQSLYEINLISEDEYVSKRSEILNSGCL